MSDYLYYTPYGAGSPTEWQTIISGPVTRAGEIAGSRTDGSQTYGCIRDIGGTCAVYQQYEVSSGPPQVIGIRFYRTGIYASIDPTNCPLDDYTSIFFIFTTGIAVLQLRKIWRIADENNDYHSSL
ncbi:hypothetical protein [Pedobacter sp. Leaf194]|uniref:hypothetical protein n=1 Tax=Pedobacter sp. Leaf194 TaxID=1736297 RepID=UPI0007024D91|nr:hypothetical protein [Pedobacter sp. Leaf194]KQS36108.1 hypothetical protein ASG14_11790 [Pedobacter sp. Leaf194]